MAEIEMTASVLVLIVAVVIATHAYHGLQKRRATLARLTARALDNATTSTEASPR